MYTMLESNLGYGASYASPSCRGAERDFLHQQQVPALSYSQMLRMSMEESGDEVVRYTDESVSRGNGVLYAGEEAYVGSSKCVLRNTEEDRVRKSSSARYTKHHEGAGGVKGYSNGSGARSVCNMKGAHAGAAPLMNVCVRQEEGFAENDYGLTCLTLGRGTPAAPPCRTFDVPSSSPQNVSRTNSTGFTRTCKLCGTSKTPLWRSGPMGAKSLCNACGIRSNKAKKLSAATIEGEDAGAARWGGKSKGFLKQAASSKIAKRKKMELADVRKKKKKKNKSEGELAKEREQRRIWQQQQQQQPAVQQPPLQQGKLPRLHVDVASSPVKTESSSCVTSRGTPSPCSTQRRPFPLISTQVQPHACLDSMCHFDDCVFPKDEEQAAFLLMALSCGLVLA